MKFPHVFASNADIEAAKRPDITGSKTLKVIKAFGVLNNLTLLLS
jgi:hypothetical protein